MSESILKALVSGPAQSVYLVHGDLVLAEPAADRLAKALAEKGGGVAEIRRHPPRLAAVLDDLATFSLFGAPKVVLAVDTAVLADRSAAAELIDDAEGALPMGEGDLPARSRHAASRLMQALRLFGIDPQRGTSEAAIADLPGWVLEGGRTIKQKKTRGRSKKEVEALASGLAQLLEAARLAGLEGAAEGDLAQLSEAVSKGFPPGHALVLVERSVPAEHPVVAELEGRGAVVALGDVTSERGGGFAGLERLAVELERETGVAMRRDALAELARRTLRSERQGAVEADSTARLAGEYRKLAHLAQGHAATGGRVEGDRRAEIDRRMVEEVVEDRGQEDVWQILDAIGSGRPGEALERYERLLASSEDPLATRLSFFALLAALCRQITAIRGVMRLANIPAGERNFKRFEERFAPAFAKPLPDGSKSPLASLKSPYRLYKAYLAACKVPENESALLPYRVLECELRLKGESHQPDVALAQLIAILATPQPRPGTR